MNQDEINPNADVIEGEVVETLTESTEAVEDAADTADLPAVTTEDGSN